ncbi:transmembrane protein, putative [Bodo saltans]|uniref:Transmembrane protein, putative n=1 Tax=Bodo saltans TaxID=75058 RepID=A0A0S4KH78_BODSA|nr:transmembrane protein, putative [Bodo saltans]|eukprot:CUI15045.1 transmembrane protein, putative [Bodo saltans]
MSHLCATVTEDDGHRMNELDDSLTLNSLDNDDDNPVNNNNAPNVLPRSVSPTVVREEEFSENEGENRNRELPMQSVSDSQAVESPSSGNKLPSYASGDSQIDVNDNENDDDDTKRGKCGSHLLPLFTDKVRNNVRSRLILVGVYAVCTAFVCLLLIYAFSSSSAPQWQVQFATPPPSTMTIGEPATTFSFEVLNGNTAQGVGGLQVFALLSPQSEVDLGVSLSHTIVVSRTLQCLRNMALFSSSTYGDDVIFCDPMTAGVLRQPVATTNVHGIFFFCLPL